MLECDCDRDTSPSDTYQLETAGPLTAALDGTDERQGKNDGVEDDQRQKRGHGQRRGELCIDVLALASFDRFEPWQNQEECMLVSVAHHSPSRISFACYMVQCLVAWRDEREHEVRTLYCLIEKRQGDDQDAVCRL